MSDVTAELKATGGVYDAGGAILLGQVKAAPLCPPYCAPRRATTAEQATVGEREVLAFTTASAATGQKLHIDSRRATRVAMDKLPSTLSASDAPAVARSDFRPALDPVLAEPTPEPTE